MDNKIDIIEPDKHGFLVSTIISDLKDRGFISGAKRYLGLLSDEDRENQDVKCTIKLLDHIVKNNVLEKNEAIFFLKDLEYTTPVRNAIQYDVKCSKTYKNQMLNDLSTKTVISTFTPHVERLNELMNKMRINSGRKSGSDAMNDFYSAVNEINKVTFETKVSAVDSNLLIIDPIENSSYNTIGLTLDEMKTAAQNKIKTFPIMDTMFGGGMIPATLIIFGALPGNFKSGTLQNIAMYAAKNNSPSDFDLDDGMKPCILFMSLEMTKRQLLERDLSFMHIDIPDLELKEMEDVELEKIIMDARKELNFQLPIVYAERLGGQVRTSVVEIEDQIIQLRNDGFQTVLLLVDYLDNMSVDSFIHRHLSKTGSDGAQLLQQKGKELRDLAIRCNVPCVSGAQLNGEASSALTKVQGYLKQIDILHHYNEGMLASSKALAREVELIILSHKIEIEERSADSDDIKVRKFIAYSVFKDRDNRVGSYIKSKRDESMEIQYHTYTTKLRNNLTIGPLLITTPRFHTVIPLDHFRLSEDDYARSIRIYYPSDKSDFTALKDLFASSGRINDIGRGSSYMNPNSPGFMSSIDSQFNEMM